MQNQFQNLENMLRCTVCVNLAVIKGNESMGPTVAPHVLEGGPYRKEIHMPLLIKEKRERFEKEF